MSYFVPPIMLCFSGARACVELCLYKEARSWLHMGLAVSFNECFKDDTRWNASNISRKINTFQTDSATHNANNVLLYCTEQFEKAKIFLKSSFDYSTKLYSKEEAILINPLTPLSDQDRISPHDINTISTRSVMRIKKNINSRIIGWSKTKFFELI